MKITSNLVLGICLMFVGVALVLDRLHLIEASQVLQFWPLGLVLFGLSLVIQALRGGGAAPPAGGSQREVMPWHVVGIVLVCILVFQTLQRGTAATRTDSNGTVSVLAVMRGDQRFLATQFRGGDMTCVMGECQLDLREATIAPGEEATIDVFALMGGVVLRVPDGWTVDARAVPVMGRVEDQRGKVEGRPRRRGRLMDNVEAERTPSPPESIDDRTPAQNDRVPHLVVRGSVMMGRLVIRS